MDNRDQEFRIADAILKALQREGCYITIGNDLHVRVSGVSEGELFLAVTCRVFKKEDKK